MFLFHTSVMYLTLTIWNFLFSGDRTNIFSHWRHGAMFCENNFCVVDQFAHVSVPCKVDTGHLHMLLVGGVVHCVCCSCDQVRILQVISTNHYYVMLMEHQVPGQPKQDLQSIHTSLTMDLAMCMSNPQNQEPYCLEQGKDPVCCTAWNCTTRVPVHVCVRVFNLENMYI